MPILRAAFVLLLPVSMLLSQARPASPAKPQASAQKRASRPSDPELENAIRARFARSKISTNRFTVRVQGGIATIEGKTEVIQHKATATRLAKAAGAVGVVNKVQIGQAARDRASANLATGRRRAQVKRGDARGEVR